MADGTDRPVDLSLNTLWDGQELLMVASLNTPYKDLTGYNQAAIEELQTRVTRPRQPWAKSAFWPT